MNDCPNVEFRDRLPDLVHERLERHERALVLAHVASCEDCRAELELLRSMRVVLAAGPRIDVSRIVASLPAPMSVVSRRASTRSRLTDWRVAAAAVVVLVGGASFAIYSRQESSPPSPETSAVVAPAGPSVASTSSTESARVGRGMDTTRERVAEAGDGELAIGGGLSDLSTRELAGILSDIDRLEPLPQTEPDLVTVSTEAPGDSS